MANLSEKELSYLEDQLSAEQLLIKKFKALSAEASDAEIKTCCDQIANKHQQHFDTMMGFLN